MAQKSHHSRDRISFLRVAPLVGLFVLRGSGHPACGRSRPFAAVDRASTGSLLPAALAISVCVEQANEPSVPSAPPLPPFPRHVSPMRRRRGTRWGAPWVLGWRRRRRERRAMAGGGSGDGKSCRGALEADGGKRTGRRNGRQRTGSRRRDLIRRSRSRRDPPRRGTRPRRGLPRRGSRFFILSCLGESRSRGGGGKRAQECQLAADHALWSIDVHPERRTRSCSPRGGTSLGPDPWGTTDWSTFPTPMRPPAAERAAAQLPPPTERRNGILHVRSFFRVVVVVRVRRVVLCAATSTVPGSIVARGRGVQQRHDVVVSFHALLFFFFLFFFSGVASSSSRVHWVF